MIAAIMAVSGVCLGILSVATRVPRMRRLPFASAVILSIGAPAALLVVDPSNFVAAILFVLGIIASSVMYAAWQWRATLALPRRGYGWYCATEFFHPRYLTRVFQEQQAELRASETAD
jgi:hypothetical protein